MVRTEGHAEFNLETHERHRQMAARRGGHGRIRMEQEGTEGTEKG
jgi:hypothetical protein